MNGDPTFNYHGGNSESNDAHESIRSDKRRMRRIILGWIEEQGDHGATSDEVEVALGWPHQTVSARLTEAKAAGLVEQRNGADSRPTRSGRNAAVLVRTEVPA